MSQTLTVFGATGQQGSSVINYVLNDPEVSQRYKLRAITRDTTSSRSQHLISQNAEVVQAYMADRALVERALTNTHTVFIMTPPSLNPNAATAVEDDIADVAIEKEAQYIIFSTLPPVSEISGGRFTNVTPFDAKAKAEAHIRSLPIESAFYCPAGFMQNFQSQPFMGPKPTGDGTLVLTRHNSPKCKIPLIDVVGDTGKFVGAILAEPDKYAGKTHCAAAALYTWEEIVAVLSSSADKTIIYQQISTEEFKKSLPFMADALTEACSFGEEFGSFGPGTEERVAWAVENARGRLTTLEEYFEKYPFRLE